MKSLGKLVHFYSKTIFSCYSPHSIATRLCTAIPMRQMPCMSGHYISDRKQLFSCAELRSRTLSTSSKFAVSERFQEQDSSRYLGSVINDMYKFLLKRPTINDDLWQDLINIADTGSLLGASQVKDIWPVRLLLKITSHWPSDDTYGRHLCDSLMVYLQSSQIHSQLADSKIVWASYIAFLSCHLGSYSVTEQRIFNLLEDKIGEFKVPEPAIIERLVCMYCNTSRWREGAELARAMPDQSGFIACFHFVVLAAFKNGDYDTALDFLDRTVNIMDLSKIRNNKNGLLVVDQPIVAAMLEATSKDESVLHKCLDILAEKKVCVTEEGAKEIQNWIKRERGWQGQLAEVKNGRCNCCNLKLKEIPELPAETLKDLGDKYKSHFMGGNYNMHTMSPSEEYERFEQFLQDMTPVDVVVDGLSLYSAHRVKSFPVLLKTIEHLIFDCGLKVLVLGRSHMEKAEKQSFKTLRKYAQVFLVKNHTKDDPFILYAAMYHGPKTFVISNDFLRDHQFAIGQILGDELNRFFRTWMKTRKVPFITKRFLPHVLLLWPPTVDMCAQYTDSTYHIPYTNAAMVEKYFVKYNQNYPRTMLCLTKPGYKLNKTRGKKEAKYSNDRVTSGL